MPVDLGFGLAPGHVMYDPQENYPLDFKSQPAKLGHGASGVSMSLRFRNPHADALVDDNTKHKLTVVPWARSVECP